MNLKFTKMHGLGNDFMVINTMQQSIDLSPATIRKLADRHLGVGFDQLLLLQAPDSDEVDFVYRIFNSDGGEVEQCGNGARCFAQYVYDNGLSDNPALRVKTNSGIITLMREDNGWIRVDMGLARFGAREIGYDADVKSKNHLNINGIDIEFGLVSVGNPHAVIAVADVDTAPVEEVGPVMESHPMFLNRINVGFMQVVDQHHIKLRVFERGVGETRACGTGACAAAIIGCRWELLKSPVDVMLPGGNLKIQWPGEGKSVLMSGPAVSVFEGCISL